MNSGLSFFKKNCLLFKFQFSPNASCNQYFFVGSGRLNKAGGPVDTIVLDAEMESNIHDQESSKDDADCV